MYKKMIFSVALIAMLTLTACGTSQSLEINKLREGTTDERNQIVDELDPTRDSSGNDELDYQLGYVNYTRDQLKNEGVQHWNVNRKHLADLISRTILNNDAFEEVATLVTDAEVLIVFDYDEDAINQEEARDIAKKTAASIMPRFYDVHVSDNRALINDIRSLHNSTTRDNNDPIIDQIIEQMEENNDG